MELQRRLDREGILNSEFCLDSMKNDQHWGKQSVNYCEALGQREYKWLARCLNFSNVSFHFQEKIGKAFKKGSKNGWLSKQIESLNMSE